MADLNENKRTFTVELASGESVELTTRFPTAEELQDAEFEFSKAFNNAIINGILPEARLLAELMKNGVWTEENDQAIEAQRLKVIDLEESLGEANGAEKVNIAEVLGEARQQLFNLRQSRSELFAHSAEAKADQAQRDYVVSRVTEYAKSGTPVWMTFQAYKKEQDNNLLFRSTYEYMTFESGLDADFIQQLPENQIASDAEKPVEESVEKQEVAAPVEEKVDAEKPAETEQPTPEASPEA